MGSRSTGHSKGAGKKLILRVDSVIIPYDNDGTMSHVDSPLPLFIVTLCERFLKDMNPHKCKSAACAMGWAPFVFPRHIEYVSRRDGLHIRLKGRRIVNRRAMERFLSISYYEASVLFGTGIDGIYKTPKQVSKVLRNYALTGELPVA